jgi:hypothetical protein
LPRLCIDVVRYDLKLNRSDASAGDLPDGLW